MNKGFTFIETLLVIAIISSLSVFGMMKIFAFQKDAKIDSVANEVLSTLKFARSKSELGEIPYSMNLEEFLPDKYPSYGVRSAGAGYEVFVQYETPSGAVNNTIGQSVTLPDDMSINIPLGIVFERLSGRTSGADIDVFYKGTPEKRIIVNSSGYFDVKDL